MTHPDDDTLAALALGETASSGVAEHVRGCPSCSDALASLRDTITTLRAPEPELVTPPSSVWGAVTAEIDRDPALVTAPDLPSDATPEPASRPRLSAAPRLPAAPQPAASAASTASGPSTGDHLAERRAAGGRRRRFPLAWVAGAAAAGLVVGVVGTRVLGDEQGPATVTVATTSLDTLDTQQVRGSADVVRHDGRLDLTVSTQPIDPDGGYLEVWLINKDLKRMVSVGVLEPGEDGQSFAIPQELLDQGYVIVDISREGFDDAPQHSGDSVVRGTLAT